MATRFSEIACYLYCAISIALFPMAADLAERHVERRRLVVKSTLANFAFCAVVGIVFTAFGRQTLSLLPNGVQYASYWWAIPWLTAITAVAGFSGFYTTAEISANRFGFMKWMIPFDFAYPAILLAVTGYGYYAKDIPTTWAAFLDAHNIRSLDTMLWWMTASGVLKAAICLFALLRQPRTEPWQTDRKTISDSSAAISIA